LISSNSYNGQALSYVYFEDEPGCSAAKLITKDEARRIAANIAKLPNLVSRGISRLVVLCGDALNEMPA
jgi:hypothetical protein